MRAAATGNTQKSPRTTRHLGLYESNETGVAEVLLVRFPSCADPNLAKVGCRCLRAISLRQPRPSIAVSCAFRAPPGMSWRHDRQPRLGPVVLLLALIPGAVGIPIYVFLGRFFAGRLLQPANSWTCTRKSYENCSWVRAETRAAQSIDICAWRNPKESHGFRLGAGLCCCNSCCHGRAKPLIRA